MACLFVTGPRGSGKSLFAVIQAFKYFALNKPVATNLNLYPDERLTGDYRCTRLPDIPLASSFLDLGLGCDPIYLQRETYDKTKFGLIILDEISLFLNAKSDKHFKEIMAYLVQSRKYGWDLIMLAQNKEQVHDEIYKPLCDNLVLCQADDLVSIPYLGKIMRMFGLKGTLPENYTALKLSGKSEQHAVMETISYTRKGYSLCYDTSQEFIEDSEYIDNVLVDMRASYSLVPDYILSGQKLIDSHINQIERIKSKVNNSKKEEGNKMAINHHQGKANAIKIGLLCLGLVVFLVLNNPLDNKLLSDVTGSSEPISEVQTVNEPIPEPVIVNQTENKQAVIDLDPYSGVFETMINDAELSIPFHSENENGLKAIVQITTPIKKSFISLDDLRVLGWYAQKTENVMFLKKGKKTIQVPLSLTSYDIKN